MRGMIRYIYNDKPYLYNCSTHPMEYWQAQGEKNVPIGSVYFFLGVFYHILYLPCLVVLSQKEQLQYSCYKIMLFVGCMDVFGVFVSSEAPGLFSMFGAHYCTLPNLMYLSGIGATGFWAASSTACIILACDRLVDLWKPHIMLFKGHRTKYWLIIPVVWSMYWVLFQPPIIYNTHHSAYLFDPLIDDFGGEYACPLLIFHNAGVPLCLVILYTAICIVLIHRSRGTESSTTSKMQKQVILQAGMLCVFNTIAATLYWVEQLIYVYPWMMIVSELSWQATHGSVAVVYVTLNRSMRNRVTSLFVHSTHTVTPIVTNSNEEQKKIQIISHF